MNVLIHFIEDTGSWPVLYLSYVYYTVQVKQERLVFD
jgi:hypothetical protein